MRENEVVYICQVTLSYYLFLRWFSFFLCYFQGSVLRTVTARYFYGINTYLRCDTSKKMKYFGTFLNFFASGSNISMIFYNISKYNHQMLYQHNKENMA
jgi:hypothetical protein